MGIDHNNLLDNKEMMDQYNRILENNGIIEFKGRHHKGSSDEFQKDITNIKNILENSNFKIEEANVKEDFDALLCEEGVKEDKNFIYLRAVKLEK